MTASSASIWAGCRSLHWRSWQLAYCQHIIWYHPMLLFHWPLWELAWCLPVWSGRIWNIVTVGTFTHRQIVGLWLVHSMCILCCHWLWRLIFLSPIVQGHCHLWRNLLVQICSLWVRQIRSGSWWLSIMNCIYWVHIWWQIWYCSMGIKYLCALVVGLLYRRNWLSFWLNDSSLVR